MHVVIAYATETGNAQALAEKLYARLRLHSLSGGGVALAPMADLEDAQWLDDVDGPNVLVVFVVSTTGEGEMPTAVRPFWTRLLNAQLPKDLFADAARFTVFGLGDSAYEKFNAAARKLRARLLQLGGVEFFGNGSGDDQVDCELAFDRWIDSLLEAIVKHSPSKWSATERELQPPSKYAITPSKEMSNNDDPRRGQDMSIGRLERITAPDWNQDVRHIEFVSDFAYESGDVLNIWPALDPEIVDRFLKEKLPEVNPDGYFCCEPRHPNLPHSVTPRQAFEEFLDLSAVPSRFFFRQAALFCSDQEERDKMLEMASSAPDNAGSYILYCKRERRTYEEVLLDFRSCNIPLAALFELIPPIRPRGYSISSSPKTHPGRIHITIALLEFLTPFKRKKVGTTSAFIRRIYSMQEGQRPLVKGFVTQGSLRLPKNNNTPLILVGTGTGCAPMRSLAYERAAITRSINPTTRNVRLYFGCRTPTDDYLYEKEWPAICDDVMVAFSKQDKRRVPVLLARDASWIFEALTEKGAYLYVSGSAKRMPADVRETLTQIIMNEGDATRDEAGRFLRQLEKERRYIVEAWS